jgi:hypothetical protein
MPRCCASINDPKNPGSAVVYVEVDVPDAKTAEAAAQQAALIAFHAAGLAGAPPQVNVVTKPGS